MVAVVVNKKAGRGKSFKRYRNELRPLLLKRIGDFIEIMENSIEKMQERIKEVVAGGLKTMIVVGGDGTLNRVVEVIKGQDIRIVPFPAGTGNDFMKSLGRDGINAEKILKCIEDKCELKWIDIGYVKTESQKHIFINGLGIGFDAEVLKTLKKIPLLGGDLLYFSAVIISLFKRKSMRMKIFHKNKTLEKEFVVFDIGNGKYLGGGFKLFPASSFLDRRLSYIGISNESFLKVIKVLNDVIKGNLENNPLIETGEFKRIKLEFNKKVAYHTDGDLKNEARFFEIGVLEQRLGVLI